MRLVITWPTGMLERTWTPVGGLRKHGRIEVAVLREPTMAPRTRAVPRQLGRLVVIPGAEFARLVCAFPDIDRHPPATRRNA